LTDGFICKTCKFCKRQTGGCHGRRVWCGPDIGKEGQIILMIWNLEKGSRDLGLEKGMRLTSLSASSVEELLQMSQGTERWGSKQRAVVFYVRTPDEPHD